MVFMSFIIISTLFYIYVISDIISNIVLFIFIISYYNYYITGLFIMNSGFIYNNY